jgi:glucose-1-phosphate cytidylyltransferase
MVPIGERPILWHIMKTYASHGHKEFILCLGYKGEVIRDYFRNYLWNTCDSTVALGRNPGVVFHNRHDEEDWTITFAETGESSMTGFRVAQAKEYVGGDETFLLTYGDGVGSVDITRSIAFHKRAGTICTLTAVHPPGRFGEIGIDEEGRIQSFNEKPQTESGYINGGFMVCSTGIFDYLSSDPELVFEQEPMKRLCADGQLAAFRHDGFWQPMDTYAESRLLNQLWKEGKAPWKVW